MVDCRLYLESLFAKSSIISFSFDGPTGKAGTSFDGPSNRRGTVCYGPACDGRARSDLPAGKAGTRYPRLASVALASEDGPTGKRGT